MTNARHLGNVVDNKLSDLKKCLLNVIIDYFNHIAALIMAQFYGHYTIEVLTIFA